MSPAPEQVRFVVDENLLRLGRAIAQLRNDVALVGQEPVADVLPIGINDSDWIPILGQRGWVMITNDQRIRTRPSESTLAVEHGLKVVHLHGRVRNQSAWQQAIRLLRRVRVRRWDAPAHCPAAQPVSRPGPSFKHSTTTKPTEHAGESTQTGSDPQRQAVRRCSDR